MTGIKLALSDGATPRNMAIIGLAVAMGMGLSAAPESLYLFPAWVTTIFGKAPVVLASMIAISSTSSYPKDTVLLVSRHRQPHLTDTVLDVFYEFFDGRSRHIPTGNSNANGDGMNRVHR